MTLQVQLLLLVLLPLEIDVRQLGLLDVTRVGDAHGRQRHLPLVLHILFLHRNQVNCSLPLLGL